jgi:hypothetical protein
MPTEKPILLLLTWNLSNASMISALTIVLKLSPRLFGYWLRRGSKFTKRRLKSKVIGFEKGKEKAQPITRAYRRSLEERPFKG